MKRKKKKKIFSWIKFHKKKKTNKTENKNQELLQFQKTISTKSKIKNTILEKKKYPNTNTTIFNEKKKNTLTQKQNENTKLSFEKNNLNTKQKNNNKSLIASSSIFKKEGNSTNKNKFFNALKKTLLKTRQTFTSNLIKLFQGKKDITTIFSELEEKLLIADVGIETTNQIIKQLSRTARKKNLSTPESLYETLKIIMTNILKKVDSPLKISEKIPFVILIVGVNGVGKTTTIAKLAHHYKTTFSKSIILAAGDTYRAAAIEQLQILGSKNKIQVIAQQSGADPASVIFDAVQAAKSRKINILISDTAGRLQNKKNLMEELKKITRGMKKLDESAPHEIMLVLDSTIGQNSINQVKIFHETIGLTGIILTKLDGTAKGGVIFSIANQFEIPIRYIGIGEKIEDLQQFKAENFVQALFTK